MGVVFLGENIPWEEFSGGNIPWGKISRRKSYKGGIFQEDLSRWELS